LERLELMSNLVYGMLLAWLIRRRAAAFPT